MKSLHSFGLVACFASFLWTAPNLPKAAAAYEVDSVHSSVIFSIKHLNSTNFYGRFNEVDGTIHYDEAKPESSSVEITIPAESVDTNNSKRDGHLKSSDFFNVKQFSKITFKSTKVEGSAKELKVTGDFTLHGVTKSITVPVMHTGGGKDPQGNSRAGFEAKFKIKRSDYGMNFMAQALSDEVEIIVSIEGGNK